MNDRNRQMAALSVFTMLLVVLGHSDISMDYKSLWHFKWIYSFHMPMFFFISGFLFCLTNPIERLRITSYAKFLKKKTVRLLVPFLFFNTLIFLVKATLIHDSSMMQHPTVLTWDSFIHHTLFAPVGFLWFLPALFVIFVLIFPFWKAVCELTVARILRLLSLVFILFIAVDIVSGPIDFLQIGSAIHYMPYFISGMVYCLCQSTVDRYFGKWRLCLTLASGVLSVSLLTQGMVAAFSGIVFCLCCSLIWADKFGSRITTLSGYCYPVFLLSYFPQMLVRGPVACSLSGVNEYLLSALSFVLGLAIPLCICAVYVPIGRRYPLVRRMGVLIGL